MSHAYYYFSASLPMIDFDSQPPVSIAVFLEDCQRLLSKNDFLLIKNVLEDSDEKSEMSNAVFNAWVKFERDFSNALVWFRAEKVGKDPLDYIRGERYSDPFHNEIIHHADKAPNLLEAEKILDRARWQFLDDLAGGHYYDLNFIIIYALKLKILDRHHEFRSPQGQSIFEELQKAEIS